MTTKQLDLLAPKPDIGNNLDIRFAAWVETLAGKTILRLFIEEALSLKRQGREHYSAKDILGPMRWKRDLPEYKDKKGFKLDNTMTSRLVRKAIEDEPRLEGFFSLRELAR